MKEMFGEDDKLQRSIKFSKKIGNMIKKRKIEFWIVVSGISLGAAYFSKEHIENLLNKVFSSQTVGEKEMLLKKNDEMFNFK